MTLVGFAISLLICASPDLGIPAAAIPLYRDALAAKNPVSPVAVSFRDLWDRPDGYYGRWVHVEGTIEREFGGPASGELPERIENWIASPSGDLTCLVFPAPRSGRSTEDRTGRIQFDGIFLGLINYESGDGVRRAPLIVGPETPTFRPVVPLVSSGEDTWGWIVAMVLLGMFAIAVARISLRRPPRRLTDLRPPVEFES